MEKVVSAIMDIIASEVCGKSIDKLRYFFSDKELVNLYKLSKAHDLAHLVGDALIKNDMISNAEVKVKFKKEVIMAVCRFERIDYEFNRLREIFNEASIPFIPLKGSVIRQYYPEPWMRTSCDIDILLHQNDLERVVAFLTEKHAYSEKSRGSHDIGLLSESGVHLELHYSLIEEKRVGTTDQVLKSVWDSAMRVADSSEYILSDEMYYFYHITHMAKHFIIGGCGIRPFLDIWVLNHRMQYDREKRNALLAEGGLLSFASKAEHLSEIWFGNEDYTDTVRQMESYLLNGGVYGTIENRVALQQVKKGGKLRYAFSRIWLPYDILKFRYPSLEGKRILLPFFEVFRWGELLFQGRVKRSIRELKLNSSTTKEDQKTIANLLKTLGLND